MKRHAPLIAVLLAVAACAAEPLDVGLTAGQTALDGEIIAVQLIVTATFEDLTPLADGGEDATIKPIRGARFEVLGEGDALLGWGITDATGGGAALFDATAGEPLRVRVLALSGHRASTVAVRSEDYAIHGAESAATAAAEVMEIAVHASAEGAGAAFNLFDDVFTTVRLLADRYGPVEGLDVVWTPGVGHPCGSCYLPLAHTILVGGSEADPDQWDDSVVLHELGHWFEAQLASTTNPGGPHDGSRTEPDQAWSEGFASFFGQALLADPVYVDSFGDGTWSMDLERMGGDHAWGTEDGTLAAPVSENLVAAVLWDFFDDGPPEPNDALAANLLVILDPAVHWFGAAEPLDTGFQGVDLADYLTGWLATGNGRWWSVAKIVLGRDYPYPFHAPPIPTP
ncbi:MAG: hypothetical protein ABIK09_20850 [Pseudomonadota bacterium]